MQVGNIVIDIVVVVVVDIVVGVVVDVAVAPGVHHLLVARVRAREHKRKARAKKQDKNRKEQIGTERNKKKGLSTIIIIITDAM